MNREQAIAANTTACAQRHGNEDEPKRIHRQRRVVNTYTRPIAGWLAGTDLNSQHVKLRQHKLKNLGICSTRRHFCISDRMRYSTDTYKYTGV